VSPPPLPSLHRRKGPRQAGRQRTGSVSWFCILLSDLGVSGMISSLDAKIVSSLRHGKRHFMMRYFSKT
jgi:hypothetical protein